MSRFLFLLLSAALILPAPLVADKTATLELAAIKKADDGTYVDFEASVTNLYANPSDDRSGEAVMSGDQILTDIASFPQKTAGNDFTPLFRFDFETRTLVNADVAVELNPFMNAEDATDLLIVQFLIDVQGSLDEPAGFVDGTGWRVLTGMGSSDVTPDHINSVTKDWNLISGVTSPIQLEGTDGRGEYRASVTVFGRFGKGYDDADWSGRTWAMPVSVTLTIASGE